MNGAKCGDLCFRNDEFAEVRDLSPSVRFIHEPTAALEVITPLAALKAIFGLVEQGVLVRNTTDDGKPDFPVRQLPLMRVLADAKRVLDEEANP
jgi:hypothetical protein